MNLMPSRRSGSGLSAGLRRGYVEAESKNRGLLSRNAAATLVLWVTSALCFIPVDSLINYKSFCGESAYNHRFYMRIVGGRGVVKGEWPWQVALQQKDPYSGKGLDQHCGGTLIHPSWILTAAHCIIDPIFKFALPPPFWTVKVGEVNLSAETQKTYPVSKIITHKLFDPKTWENDIALVKLRQPLVLEEHAGMVNTICLPSRNMSFIGLQCSVTGWGRTKEQHGTNSDLLQTIRVPVMTNKKCQRAYRKINPVGSRMICAGWDDGGMGPCVGDSGGPLQCRERGGPWIQAGITSWGVGCAEPSYPGVYIRVTEYLDWIYKHMEKS
ncbi:tryptase beta-2-like [Palaemon carinicauda]|uniref:tryptase beta-2-like n=1 Tax=Palaemon carinicauda TaxID=392227 RepID=UPI0035B6298D